MKLWTSGSTNPRKLVFYKFENSSRYNIRKMKIWYFKVISKSIMAALLLSPKKWPLEDPKRGGSRELFMSENITKLPKKYIQILQACKPNEDMKLDWNYYFFKNWDSLYARLNSHYKAWSYKKKKHKKIEAYRKSL